MPYKTTYEYTKRDKRTGVQTLVNYLCETCNLKENQDILGYYSEQKEQKKIINFHIHKTLIHRNVFF